MCFWKGRRLSEELAVMALGFMFMVPSDPLYVPKGIGIFVYPFFQMGKQTWGGLTTCQRSQSWWQSQMQILICLWVYPKMLNYRKLVGILVWLYLHLADKAVAKHQLDQTGLRLRFLAVSKYRATVWHANLLVYQWGRAGVLP